MLDARLRRRESEK